VKAHENENRLSGGLMSMNEIVEFFNTVFEVEIKRWSGFHRALRKDDREAFEALMDMFRSYSSEVSCTTNPRAFEPLVMSIILAQLKKMEQLEYKVNDVLWQKISSQENKP
jgi:hypothetical protein